MNSTPKAPPGLIACHTCRRAIAKSANQCPHCGAPRIAGFSWARIITRGFVLLMILLAVGIYLGHRDQERQNQLLQESENVRKNLEASIGH